MDRDKANGGGVRSVMPCFMALQSALVQGCDMDAEPVTLTLLHIRVSNSQSEAQRNLL